MNSAMTLLADDPIPTRYSLLSRLRDWDDQDSWKEFFDIYWRLIYSVALKAGLTQTEAQEVVQETIISVAKGIHKFRRDRALGSFKGWLRNLTRWRIADQLRKRTGARSPDSTFSPGPARPLDAGEIPDLSGGGLESLWDREWQSNLMEVAMDRVKRRVKEEHYQMFDLYVVKHWPVIKVARTLGVNVGQVYLAKHRISAILRKEVRALEEQWY
jgi:RNA polymerase sigma factor (sigma-70 family)